MRAVKSVLVIAGNLKKEFPETSEEVLLIKAMRDANVPKFLADDLPLFDGIVTDLFPHTTVPQEAASELSQQIEHSCVALNLLLEEPFKKKCLQLSDTFKVRFGVMLVGPTGGGKSTCFKVLEHARTELGKLKKKDSQYREVRVKIMNPKSITMGELYGEQDLEAGEWTDGLASKKIRKAVDQDKKHDTWVVFDGPVDSLWIENMNTVLDDNMTLCLANGERIKLKPSMHILFEVQDLKVASPATVSRCGMVYLTPSELGWKPYVHKWIKTFFCQFPDHLQAGILALFEAYVEEAFKKSAPYVDQQQLKCEPIQIVQNICNLLETFLSKPNALLAAKRED